MSADNWAICPQCEKNHERELVVREKALNNAYGEVRPEMYIRMLGDFKAFESKPLDRTLLEEYEQGVLDEEYYLTYSGKCTVCGWSFTKEITEKIEVK